ncbi:hypothetical protein [Streptomyces sp. NPDC058653]|uniref:hypothetical protein n=1 Tax=Streptomyces sp. NPDC058653 TaxID=3346576 RepID=UPI00366314A8
MIDCEPYLKPGAEAGSDRGPTGHEDFRTWREDFRAGPDAVRRGVAGHRPEVG